MGIFGGYPAPACGVCAIIPDTSAATRTTGLEISRRRAAEKEAVAFAVCTNKAEFKRGAADLTLHDRGAISENLRIRLVRQRPRIAGTVRRRGNTGCRQVDPIVDGVPAVAGGPLRRRRHQPALDDALEKRVAQAADDVSRRGLEGSVGCRFCRSGQYEAAQHKTHCLGHGQIPEPVNENKALPLKGLPLQVRLPILMAEQFPEPIPRTMLFPRLRADKRDRPPLGNRSWYATFALAP
jgi:hypothetical protein